MATISEPSIFESLFQSALEEFEKETKINLAGHPLAAQLESCNSVESITELLHNQARTFRQFRGHDNKLMTVLNDTVQGLDMLSGIVTVAGAVGFQVPFVDLIHTGIGVLLSAIQDMDASYDALVDLFETICNFLMRLEIYTKIRLTPAMMETIVKILVQLTSILAVATKQVKQGRLKKVVKKLFGENDVEMVLHRLERLTLDESLATGAQTLEVVHGLAKNLREVMSDREASTYDIQKALEMMQQLINGMNESKREKLRQNVRSWLSPPDPWKNYNIGRDAHHNGTARWFIQGDRFAEWKSSSYPLLWIHGKPGAGKSLLCSSIIEEIDGMRESGLASLGFYYFDFRDDEKKHRRGLLSSLLFQLCNQSATYCDILSRLYSSQGDGSQTPSDSDLTRCLEEMLRSPGQAPVYLIIDALDECPDSSDTPSPRENVLKLVEQLTNLRLPNLRICLTSRPEVDIKEVLDDLEFHSISLHDEEGQNQDILDYITSVVRSDPKMQKWRAEDKERVIDELSQKADGMFRWVFCQLDFLRRCLPARIERALAELPKTLDDTYERILLEISEANWEFAHRLLQCVAVAYRPLRVDELAEFLAFDFKTGPIPEFHESFRLADPIHAVLSTCPSLLSVVNVYDSEVIQFSHFSVKEYLMSARLAEGGDIMSRRYHVSMTDADTLAAQACLGTLLHLDENIDRDSLEKFPLAEYSAWHWVEHVELEDVSERVEAGLKQLFDPRKPHLAIWLWIRKHDPVDRRIHKLERDERPLQPNGTCLHYAAFYGLHKIVEFLVTEDIQQVNSLGFGDRSTPLHLAVRGEYSGTASVTRVLLKLGAYAMAWDSDGRTALHFAAKSPSSQAMEVIRALLEAGADPTAQDMHGRNPLHWAAGSSSSQALEIVRALMEAGADATAQDEDRCTPLHEAAGSESSQALEVVLALMEAGADPTAQDMLGRNPLHQAAGLSTSQTMGVVREYMSSGEDPAAKVEGCNVEGELSLQAMKVVGALIEGGADATAHDKYGRTPLHSAARFWLSHAMDVVGALIEGGADATAQDEDQRTPLHEAAGSESPQVMEIVRALIEAGADPTAQDMHGHNPLHEAARSWSSQAMEVMRALIEAGADPAAQDKDGRNPLHEAAGSSQAVEVVRAFIEAGADPTAQDMYGRSPLHLAAGSQSYQATTKVVRALMEAGADPTAQDMHGCNPLHFAAGSSSSRATVVRALIEGGADPTAEDMDGRNPLHTAAGSSSSQATEVVRALIEGGADPTAHDIHGCNPLHLAAGSSSSQVMEVVRALIEGGADATAHDKDGCTPLYFAAGSSSSQAMEIIRLLLEAGAAARAQGHEWVYSIT